MLDKLEANNTELTNTKDMLERTVRSHAPSCRYLCHSNQRTEAAELQKHLDTLQTELLSLQEETSGQRTESTVRRMEALTIRLQHTEGYVCFVLLYDLIIFRWLSVPKNNNLKKFGWEPRFAVLLSRPVCLQLFADEEMNVKDLMYVSRCPCLLPHRPPRPVSLFRLRKCRMCVLCTPQNSSIALRRRSLGCFRSITEFFLFITNAL
jgi:hypothetical protein